MRRASSLIAVSCAIILILGLCLSVGTAHAAKYTWKLALEEIQGSVQDTWAQEFKRRIEEKSNGEVEIIVYPYGTLGTGFGDIAEATQNGILEFAFTSPAYIAPIIPEVRVFSLHYLWSDNMQANKDVMANSGVIYGLLGEQYEKKNLKLMTLFTEGWQVWTTNKPIRTPADMKGVKIRVMSDPILIENYRAYGADPVQIAYSEIYSALQLGMIDAQVQPVFATEEMKFYEQQKYLIWAQQVPYITSVSANAQFFKSLPKKYQDMIMDTSREMVDYIFDVQEKFNTERLDIIKKKKPSIQTIYLTKEERAAFEKLARPVWNKYIEMAGKNGRQILEQLVKDIEEAEKKYR